MLCYAVSLGLISYDQAYEIQRRIHARRLRREVPDVVLLLEHYPVVTIGKSGSIENLLVSLEDLRRAHVSLFFTDRGGDVTYHGPGQLVFYPILDLREHGKDLRMYVYRLEEVFIETLKDFSIDAKRHDSHRGVFVDSRQIVAIGIAIKRWITMHGAAFNVKIDPGAFSIINPCGLKGLEAASLEGVLGRPVQIDSVKGRILRHFSSLFRLSIEEKSLSEVL